MNHAILASTSGLQLLQMGHGLGLGWWVATNACEEATKKNSLTWLLEFYFRGQGLNTVHVFPFICYF